MVIGYIRPHLKYGLQAWLRTKIALNKFREWQDQTVNDGVAHSKNPRKCVYHVTFDFDLDLEHTLDAR